MLTKNDLQQIRSIVKDEARIVVKEELTLSINSQIRPIVREEARTIIREELLPLIKDQRSMKRKLNRVAKDVHYIAGDYDLRIVENKREIQKIKSHLGLAQ